MKYSYSLIGNLLSIEVNEVNEDNDDKRFYKNLVQRVILDDTWLPLNRFFSRGENCGGGWTRTFEVYYEISVDTMEKWITVREDTLESKFPLCSDRRLEGKVLFNFEEEVVELEDRFSQDILYRKVVVDGESEEKKYVKVSSFNKRYWNTKTVSPINAKKIILARRTETGEAVAIYPDIYPQDVSDLFV